MWLELLVVIACGAGTFLLRFLPIWRMRRRARAPDLDADAQSIQARNQTQVRHGCSCVQRFFVALSATPLGPLFRGVKQFQRNFFAGIGPSALTALLLVSLWPFFRDGGHVPRLVSATVALIVLYVAKRMTRGLAVPTLLGAAVYGMLIHWWMAAG